MLWRKPPPPFQQIYMLYKKLTLEARIKYTKSSTLSPLFLSALPLSSTATAEVRYTKHD